jgi:hypothetical protein
MGATPGVMPAVGGLFGIPACADRTVRDDSGISLDPDSHRSAVRVERVAWEQAAEAVDADIAVGEWLRPTRSRPWGPAS